MRWLLLLPLVLLADLALLVAVGGHLGLWPTLALLVATAAAGIAAARSEGLRVLREYLDAVGRGELPEEGILSGLLVVAGGALLLFPGLLSDAAGLLLLVPYTRRGVAARLRARIYGHLPTMHVVDIRGPHAPFEQQAAPFWDPAGGGPEVIDTEGVSVETERLLPASSAASPPDADPDSGEPEPPGSDPGSRS